MNIYLKNQEKSFLIYDIEVGINYFYIYFFDIDKKSNFELEISEYANNIKDFLKFIKEYKDYYFTGFNSLNYDAKVLSFLFDKIKKGKINNIEIFNFSDKLIKKETNYKIKYLNHLDLAEIGGYNTKATSASLKLIEFNLRLPNIENLPFPPEKRVNKKELEIIKYYCKNDVFATKELFFSMQNEISIRLDDTYKNILNLPNTKLGEEILKQELNLPYLYTNKENFEEIEIKNIIFDYIKFETPILKKLLKYISNKEIKTPKSFFTELDFKELEDLEGYYVKDTYKNKQKNLNIWYHNMKIVLGTGGLHGSKNGIFKSSKNRIIIDIDVSSYYPNIAISNNLIPSQIKKLFEERNEDSKIFLEKYSSFSKRRKLYKKPHPLNTLYKLALNIIFGKSLKPSSIFGDLKYGMGTTINGQLMLLMLIEKIFINIYDVELIQVNTDGITLMVEKEYLSELKTIVNEWEETTKLKMEFTYYKQMIIANVNNYIAEKENGSIKSKGALFSYKNLEHHKNHSMLIVPMALEEYFIKHNNPIDFIKNHKDIFDFCKRVKLKKNTKLVYRTKDNGLLFQQEFGKVTRYLVTKDGGKLVKIFESDKEEQVEADYFTMPVNRIDNNNINILFKKIDYNYYIKKTLEYIKKIKNNESINNNIFNN